MKKRILITNYFKEKLQHHLKKTFSFFENHGNRYDFLTSVLENTSLNYIRSLQGKFLDDLMNGFNVYKKIKGANSVKTFIYICWEIRKELFMTYF